MTVTYDSIGAAFAGVTTAGVAKTFTHTAAAGADVFFALTTYRQDTVSSVTFAGNAMTLVGSYNHNNNNGSTVGTSFLYRLAGGGTGSSATASFTCALAQWAVANTISYTGVGSVGTPQYAYGSTTAISTGSVTCGSGQVILAALGVGSQANNLNPLINSPSGGTVRYNVGAGSSGYDAALCIQDATSTATFAGTGNFSFLWSTITVALLPPSAPLPAMSKVPVIRSAYY